MSSRQAAVRSPPLETTSPMNRDLIERRKYPDMIMQRCFGHARLDVSMHIYHQVVEDDLDLATVTPPSGSN